MTLLETLRKLGLTSLKLTPEDTQPLRVVRDIPARKPRLDKGGLLAWQLPDGTIVYLELGRKPEVRR